jgi:hypothetical protein
MRHLLDWSVWVQVPEPLHRSSVHERPSLVHAVELERLVHAEVDVLVAHHWHPFVGFAVVSL